MIRLITRIATGASCVVIVFAACFAPPGMSAAWFIWGALAVIFFTMVATPIARSWQKARAILRASQIFAERGEAAELVPLTPREQRALRCIEEEFDAETSEESHGC